MSQTMSNRRFLVTSALPYSNGRLHVGHIAGAYLPADTYVRYLRARGDEVRFICGSDDNGVAGLISARKEGVSVEELTARYPDDPLIALHANRLAASVVERRQNLKVSGCTIIMGEK